VKLQYKRKSEWKERDGLTLNLSGWNLMGRGGMDIMLTMGGEERLTVIQLVFCGGTF
jgi:hypothetical protein